MKRAGFTMIELIFVIVILGILGAVAIPKLSGIKDDAQLANANENICINIKGSTMAYAVRHNGSLEDFNLSKYADLAGWDVINNNGVLSSDGNNTLTAVDGDSLDDNAVLANTTNNVYVFFVDGNDTVNYGCLIGNSATPGKSAAQARDLIASGSNYL